MKILCAGVLDGGFHAWSIPLSTHCLDATSTGNFASLLLRTQFPECSSSASGGIFNQSSSSSSTSQSKSGSANAKTSNQEQETNTSSSKNSSSSCSAPHYNRHVLFPTLHDVRTVLMSPCKAPFHVVGQQEQEQENEKEEDDEEHHRHSRRTLNPHFSHRIVRADGTIVGHDDDDDDDDGDDEANSNDQHSESTFSDNNSQPHHHLHHTHTPQNSESGGKQSSSPRKFNLPCSFSDDIINLMLWEANEYVPISSPSSSSLSKVGKTHHLSQKTATKLCTSAAFVFHLIPALPLNESPTASTPSFITLWTLCHIASDSIENGATRIYELATINQLLSRWAEMSRSGEPLFQKLVVTAPANASALAYTRINDAVLAWLAASAFETFGDFDDARHASLEPKFAAEK